MTTLIHLGLEQKKDVTEASTNGVYACLQAVGDSSIFLFTYKDAFLVAAENAEWFWAEDELVVVEDPHLYFYRGGALKLKIVNYYSRYGRCTGLTKGKISFVTRCVLVDSGTDVNHVDPLPAPAAPVEPDVIPVEPAVVVEEAEDIDEAATDGSGSIVDMTDGS